MGPGRSLPSGAKRPGGRGDTVFGGDPVGGAGASASERAAAFDGGDAIGVFGIEIAAALEDFE